MACSSSCSPTLSSSASSPRSSTARAPTRPSAPRWSYAHPSPKLTLALALSLTLALALSLALIYCTRPHPLFGAQDLVEEADYPALGALRGLGRVEPGELYVETY